MDIDLLGKTSNDEARLLEQVREILSVEVEPDGLIFESESIQTGRITEDADYEGIRIRFRGTLGSACINMQIDIGFGDSVYPEPQESELPTLLDGPPARVLCYSRESAIAEKFEVMLKHGELNSRMKDFYDIWLLSREYDFDGANLAEAIRRTLQRRGMQLPGEIVAFTGDFASSKQIAWSAFRKRLAPICPPESFGDVVRAVAAFLTPVVSSISTGITPPVKWTASGPWV